MTMTLEGRSLFYRRPDLYDQVRGEPDGTLADLLGELVDEYSPDAHTLFDVGCGTGYSLGSLAGRFEAVGIDLQPRMVAYARSVRPGLDIRVGDMRTFRLGHSVDIVLCIGYTLAYLHDDDDLGAGFATFAAHAHPGTLLVLHTQIAPTVLDETEPVRVDTADLHGAMTGRYAWDAETRLNTFYRHWRLDDGTEHRDIITRRVIEPGELERYATYAGFRPVEVFNHPGSRGKALSGAAGAWFVAIHDGTRPLSDAGPPPRR